MRDTHITQFTRQLATLLRAGIALLQALDIVIKGMPNGSAKNMVRTVRRRIENGSALHTALREHAAFGSVYCDVIAAGEMAGMLEPLLERLAQQREKTAKLRQTVRSATAYPTAVLVIASGVMVLLLTFVVPAFENTFSAFQAELPALTRAVIACSHALAQYGVGIAAILLAAVIACNQLLRRNRHWLKHWDVFVLQLPVVGALMRQACIARWTRTLATLFAAGLPLPEALIAIQGVAGNTAYRNASLLIRSHLLRGRSMAQSVACVGPLFDPWVVHMCAIGEESGTLEHMLFKTAEHYEAEVESSLARLSSLMEPLLVCVLGGIVGTMVVALYLPIFELGNVV